MTTTAPCQTVAADEAHLAWYWHAGRHGIRNVHVTPWEHVTAPDGTPMITAEAVGGEALLLVQSLNSEGVFTLDEPSDVRPRLDVSVPGRVACVWRTDGVWVSLWAAEPTPPAVRPSPAPRRASAPAGRLLRWLDSSKPTPAA